jgi:hypothetical protein
LFVSLFLIWFNFSRLKEQFYYFNRPTTYEESVNQNDKTNNNEDSQKVEPVDLNQDEMNSSSKSQDDESSITEEVKGRNQEKNIHFEENKILKVEKPKEQFSYPKTSEKKKLKVKSTSENLEETLTILNKKYHIISGAFRPKYRAQKKVESYLSEGYNARILPKKIGGLYHVALESFEIKPPAIDYLRSQRSEGKKVWLLTMSM